MSLGALQAAQTERFSFWSGKLRRGSDGLSTDERNDPSFTRCGGNGIVPAGEEAGAGRGRRRQPPRLRAPKRLI